MSWHFFNLIIPLAVLAPNVLGAVLPPQGASPNDSSPLLTALERSGQAGIFILPLLYDVDLAGIGTLSLAVMLGSLLFYYLAWARFFLMGRQVKLLFSPMWGIPIPLALSPILFFLAAAGVLRSWLLLIAALVFALGHIPISYKSHLATRED